MRSGTSGDTGADTRGSVFCLERGDRMFELIRKLLGRREKHMVIVRVTPEKAWARYWANGGKWD